MRKYNVLMYLLLMVVTMDAQFINNGATVTIQPGATLRVETSFENQAGTIDNQGTLEVQGNFTNATGAGTTLSGIGKLKFFGTSNSSLSTGGDALHKVEILKTTSAGTVTLASTTTMNDSLIFSGSSEGSKIVLGAFDLTLGSGGTVTGASQTAGYVVTGSTGKIIKTNLGATAFTFPVGFDATTYNPVTVAENGTTDNIGIRVLEKAYINGSSGTALTPSVVDATWVISDVTAGGNNLSVTPSWKASDEVSFNRSLCRVARYNGQKFDLDDSTKAAATGSDPYSRQRTGITNVGNFIVSSSSFVKVAPKVFLEGPYIVAEAKMTDIYRTYNKIAMSQPYNTLSFTGDYPASHNGTEFMEASVLLVSGDNAIVDWVLLELRDNVNRSTVVSRRAALIQRDGDVVDTDGISPVRFDNISDGNYHLSVRHRLHLGTRTANSIALSETFTTINFTNNSNALASSLKELSNGSNIFGLKTGDVNRDGFIVSSDIVSIRGLFNTSIEDLSFTYLTHSRDCNLDGFIVSGDIVKVRSNFNLEEINHNQ